MFNEWSLRGWLRESRSRGQPVSFNYTRDYYISKITRLATSQFTWECDQLADPSLIEKYLWQDGRAMIWNSKSLGWIVTRCIEKGWNINGNANQWEAQFDMEQSSIDRPILGMDDQVGVCYDLPNHILKRSACLFMCEDVADINETIRQQVFNQKTPMIGIVKDQASKNKVKQVMVDIHDNAKALLIDSDIADKFSTIDFNAPFNVKELFESLKGKEYEMLEYLGIDSQMAFQKGERLIVDEQEANDEIINLLLNDALQSRKKCAKELRSKGLDIDVWITDNVRPISVINDGNGSQGGNNGTDRET